MRIRMYDNVAQYLSDKEAIDAAVLSVLESGELVMGPDVRALEEEFAACGNNCPVILEVETPELAVSTKSPLRAIVHVVGNKEKPVVG